MGKSHSSTNLASCFLAAIFLIFVVIAALAVYFTMFKPKDPKLSVNAVQLPSFSVANSSSSNSTVTFTFSEYVTVNNPNRAVFTHYDSSFQLLHAGNKVGFLFVPAGKIGPGKTQYIAATFNVKLFPLALTNPGQPQPGPELGDGFGPGIRPESTMEIESRLEMAGRVRVLHFFTHHVEARADCRVAVDVTDGSVLGFHC